MKLLASIAKIILALALWIIVSLLALKFLPVPWIWIYLSGITILVWFAWRARDKAYKLLFIYMSTVPAALLLLEAGFIVFVGTVASTGNYNTDRYFLRNDVLGYAPRPNTVRSLKRSFKGETIFDVTYAINEHALRYTPSSNELSDECILQFGGSFAFGAGLDNNQTFLSFLGDELGNRYRLLNFGFHGYGAHQMLSAIEQNYVAERIKGCRSIISIYMAIPGHISRVAGLSWWDPHGPRYMLENDEAVLKGNFDSDAPIYSKIKALRIILALSPVLKRLFITNEVTNVEQRRLYFKVVDKAKHLLESIRPNARFLAILYEADNNNTENVKQESQSIIKHWSDNQYEFYLAGDVLDEYDKNAAKYYLHTKDKHPNALATSQLATGIARHIRLPL